MTSSDPNALEPIATTDLTALARSGKDTVRMLECRTIARGGSRQEHHVRDLAPFGNWNGPQTGLLDEETSPSPSELLLAALGSCLVIGIHANAVARSIPITKLELVLSAEIHFGGIWGAGDLAVAPIGFEDISIAAHIASDASEPVLQSLLDHVLIWSPVANSLHNPVSLTASLVPV